MLKTRIKASQVTNLTDARYFSAWEVNWLGFNFEAGTTNYITPTTMKAIRDWVEGPRIVGEFGMMVPENLAEVVDFFALDVIQVGHFVELDALIELRNVTIIKEIVIDLDSKKDSLVTLLNTFTPHVEAFILDFEKNKITWTFLKNHTYWTVYWLKKLCQDYNIILSLDVNKSNVLEILEAIRPYGLNVVGGDEEKVGLKSFEELDDIFEILYKEED